MKNLLTKIKSRGFWIINFRPLIYEDKIKNLFDCKNIVEKNIVSLRGWNYPFFPLIEKDNMKLSAGQNFYEGWVDWQAHKEIWRIYQSGQFIHLLALREDWYEESEWFKEIAKKIKPETSLGIIHATYLITEIFEFLRRLVSENLYNEGIKVVISLNNAQNRVLWLEDGSRVPLSKTYSTASSILEYSKEFSKNQIETNSKNISLEVIKFFFDKFGWHHCPIDVVKSDQEKLLSNRI